MRNIPVYCIQCGQPFGLAAVRRHLHQWRSQGRSENDDALKAPTTAAAVGRIAQHLGAAARNFDSAEFPVREKADAPTIGRPEGKRCAVRAFDPPRSEFIYRTYPKLGVTRSIGC